MTLAISLHHIQKSFDGRSILDDFELTVQQGEVIGILGPSGIGKSTVLRMIAGLEIPDSGHIEIGLSRMGYVFQEPRLLPWDTTLRNVTLPMQAQGIPRQQAEDKARDCLEQASLAGFEQHLPHQLSGGMRQRVSIVRALAVTPEILLLDEPFTGLDPDLKEKMRQFVGETVTKQKTTVIHVTHDAAELSPYTSRTLHMTGPFT